MEIAAIILALAIAMGQLHLQHAEIRRNGQINTLVHMSGMLKDKIDHDESIIKEMKTTGADWTCHAHRVEDEWRPLLAQVNAKLINTIAAQKGVVTDTEVELSLQLGEEPYGQRGAPVQAPAV